MVLAGLTGSIGMGKTTVASMFLQAGVPVHDADAQVHALYRGAAVEHVLKAFPQAGAPHGIDRAALSKLVLGQPEALAQLEGIIHPLVLAGRNEFLARTQKSGARLAVLDIPLLFETGAQDSVDLVIVVSAPASLQRERVMARPGMTEEKFSQILARQMPDTQKRRLAHHVFETGHGIGHTQADVLSFLRSTSAMTVKGLSHA